MRRRKLRSCAHGGGVRTNWIRCNGTIAPSEAQLATARTGRRTQGFVYLGRGPGCSRRLTVRIRGRGGSDRLFGRRSDAVPLDLGESGFLSSIDESLERCRCSDGKSMRLTGAECRVRQALFHATEHDPHQRRLHLVDHVAGISGTGNLVLVLGPNDCPARPRARSEWDAQVGPIFAGFIKVLPVFLMVFPGVIAYVLFRDKIGEDADATLERVDPGTPAARNAGPGAGRSAGGDDEHGRRRTQFDRHAGQHRHRQTHSSDDRRSHTGSHRSVDRGCRDGHRGRLVNTGRTIRRDLRRHQSDDFRPGAARSARCSSGESSGDEGLPRPP